MAKKSVKKIIKSYHDLKREIEIKEFKLEICEQKIAKNLLKLSNIYSLFNQSSQLFKNLIINKFTNI